MWILVPKPPRLRPRAGSAPLFLGAPVALTCARTTVRFQPHGGQIRICLQVGHQTRPDAPIAPVRIAAIDRVPLAVLGRQLTPRGTPLCHPARRFHKKATMIFMAHAYTGTGNQKRVKAMLLGIDHRGPSSGPHAKRGIAGRITVDAQDVQFPLPASPTRPESGCNPTSTGPSAARTAGVYAPARQLAPQGRTGIERSDAADPDRAYGDAGRATRR